MALPRTGTPRAWEIDAAAYPATSVELDELLQTVDGAHYLRLFTGLFTAGYQQVPSYRIE